MTNKTKAELEVDISKLEKQIEDLQTQLTDAQAGGTGDATLSARIKELEDLNGTLTKERDDLRDELDGNEEDGASYDTQIAELNKNLASEKERADSAEKALNEQNVELEGLRTRTSELTQKIETMSIRGATLHGHIDDLKAPY